MYLTQEIFPAQFQFVFVFHLPQIHCPYGSVTRCLWNNITDVPFSSSVNFLLNFCSFSGIHSVDLPNTDLMRPYLLRFRENILIFRWKPNFSGLGVNYVITFWVGHVIRARQNGRVPRVDFWHRKRQVRVFCRHYIASKICLFDSSKHQGYPGVVLVFPIKLKGQETKFSKWPLFCMEPRHQCKRWMCVYLDENGTECRCKFCCGCLQITSPSRWDFAHQQPNSLVEPETQI